MLEHRVSGLPVIGQDGALIGIVTERDLLRRPEIGTALEQPKWVELWLTTDELAQEYVHSHGRMVGDVMTRQVVTIGADTPLDEIVALMTRDGLKRLPVVRDRQVIGIVSRADLLRAFLRRIDGMPQSAAGDLSIKRRIQLEISGKRWAPRPAVNIAVCDGVVELTGTVASELMRNATRVAAENAPGVKRVIDNLRVASRPD
jgi:predicted transcriptional regulator